MLVIAAQGDGPPAPTDCGSVPVDPVTRSFGIMLVGMTPSTHDGRRKLLAGVDGGELTGEIVTRSGADPLRFDAATDAPHPSSSDGFPPDVSPGRVEHSSLPVLTVLYFPIVLSAGRTFVFSYLFSSRSLQDCFRSCIDV